MRRLLLLLALLLSPLAIPRAGLAAQSVSVTAQRAAQQPAIAVEAATPGAVADVASGPVPVPAFAGPDEAAEPVAVEPDLRLGFGFLLHHVRTGCRSVAGSRPPPSRS